MHHSETLLKDKLDVFTFSYGYAQVKDFGIKKTHQTSSGAVSVEQMKVGGRIVLPTKRFWKSFFTRFKVSENVFRYFSPPEVFDRISRVAPNDKVRYCIESGGQKARLLAVSSPDRPVITKAEVEDLVSKHHGTGHEYDCGLVRSEHVPWSGEHPFKVGDDEFRNRFVMETPIDGFGQPNVYLSLLREICSNGAVGYTRAFRSEISAGKQVSYSISRAIESYDNGEGYAALRQRFESAQTSWASVRECSQLLSVIENVSERGDLNTKNLLRGFFKMTGNLNEIYGLANLNALSVKRQRVLPSKCRIYDLLNFASELATHHSEPAGARSFQSFIGSLISDEYDMEGTAETAVEFGDFFLNPQQTEPAISLN